MYVIVVEENADGKREGERERERVGGGGGGRERVCVLKVVMYMVLYFVVHVYSSESSLLNSKRFPGY
jgi:hypothetical protein